MKRMVLLLTTVTLATAMVLTSTVLSIAQEDPPSEAPPFEDTTDNPSFNDTGDEPPTDTAPFEDTTDNPSFGDGSGQEAPLCTPEWLQEWHPDFASGWWWFWWYQWCWTSKDGWYRSYDGWDWGPAIW